ncbi:MAG: High-affinity branched-chain amino acid transport ATP-binding protein LivF [Bacteroidia bacterium]|nr:High-affinity branched-chain amino acid transport ATP-binding protein LivF [Bacteroidia bacterium]
MLRVENISTGYGKKQVLFDVSLEVKQGEIVLLAGSNGSGKSTLLKAIYGMLPQWSNGQIFFNGENITGKPTATLLKKGLLFIPQKNNLFDDLTVKENLEMAGLTLDNNTLRQRTEQALSIFTSLAPHLQQTPMKLSGGEKTLLTLAMATLHQPKMVLVDEPFSGLSEKNLTFVAENLKVLNQKSGITLLIVEHRVKESIRIANRIIGLKLGKILNQMEVNEKFNVIEMNSIFV